MSLTPVLSSGYTADGSAPQIAEHGSEALFEEPSTSACKPFRVSLYSSKKEFEALEFIVLDSILDSPHPLQGSIVSIAESNNKLLIHDGVHLCLREGSNSWQHYSIPDGILCIDSELHVITKAYQLVDLFDTSLSLVDFMPPVADFALLDAVSVVPSSFLLLFYLLTGIKTTSVDFRLQNYALFSLSTRTVSDWLPGAVLFPQSIQDTLLPVWSRRETSVTQMQMLHCWICRQIRLQAKLPIPVDEFLELRKRLLEVASESSNEPAQQSNNREVCKCCGELSFRSEGHADWCCLSSVDLYCPLTGKLLADSAIIHVCPCCQQEYAEAAHCAFCGLKLMVVMQGPSTLQTINKEFIYNYFGTSVDEVWNQ